MSIVTTLYRVDLRVPAGVQEYLKIVEAARAAYARRLAELAAGSLAHSVCAETFSVSADFRDADEASMAAIHMQRAIAAWAYEARMWRRAQARF